jgi:acyl phosphate:glycerol-3-phosphate acyltransferase
LDALEGLDALTKTMPWIQQLQSANWSQASWIALGAYLLGCVATGYYLVRLRTEQDIRELGSGSIGARNVGRVLGRTGFLATVFGDGCKGALAIWVALHFTSDQRVVALALVAVVIGHIWPVQLKFRGGKGIATSLGALLIYDFHLIFAFVILFAAFFAVLRKTVLPGLFAMACLPLVSLYLAAEPAKAIGISIVAGLVLITHRKNLMEESIRVVARRNVSKTDRTNL